MGWWERVKSHDFPPPGPHMQVFFQTPSTVAADLKKRLGMSQTWSGVPVTSIFFFQFLKVKISRKNTAYWILSKGRWHLSRFPPCVGWMEWLSRSPLNSIKVWLICYSTKQTRASSGTQKQCATPVNLLSQGCVHIWCPSSGARVVAQNIVSLRYWVLQVHKSWSPSAEVQSGVSTWEKVCSH